MKSGSDMTPSSATAGVSVKPIAWRPNGGGTNKDLYSGELAFNTYYTVDEDGTLWRAWFGQFLSEYGPKEVGAAPDVEAVKALAQADYVARIMSALTVTSFPPAEQHDVTSHAVPHDGEGAVAPEPYKWEGYWPGAGSIDSITRHASHKPTAEKWEADGAEVTPLFTHPAPVAAQPVEGLRDLLNREDIKHALEIARMGRPYSDVQGHLYMNERYKSHPGSDAQFTDYGLAHAACVLFNAADDILRALSALPAQPNSSEGEPT